MAKWSGYQRFCSLARGLDVIGERWTLPLIQELLWEPARYNELRRRLPGIGSNILADRLRKLEQHGVVRRSADAVGQGVTYELTERGRALGPALTELRKWGVAEQLMLDPDAPDTAVYDLSYAVPPSSQLRETYQWNVDDEVVTLELDGTTLTQTRGPADDPAVVVTTSAAWLHELVSGGTDWNEGRASGAVVVGGDEGAWGRMLAATKQPGHDSQLLG